MHILSRILMLVVVGLGTASAPAQTFSGGPHVPDLSGVWQLWDADPAEAQKVDPKYHPLQPGMPALKGAYKQQFEAEQAQASRRAEENRVVPGSAEALRETSCMPYGMPNMMYPQYTLEVLQAPKQVTIVAEAMLEVRRIYIGKPQLPIEEVAPGYEGRSVGRWEGDTFVVDTVGVKTSVAGPMYVPHSDQMRIKERLRLLTPDLLQNVITVEDPLAFEQPYTFTILLARLNDYETPEFYCDNIRETVDPVSGELKLRVH